MGQLNILWLNNDTAIRVAFVLFALEFFAGLEVDGFAGGMLTSSLVRGLRTV